MDSDNKITFMCPYISLRKTCDPRVGIFWPQGPAGMIRTNLVQFHKMMLHYKCQGSSPYGFLIHISFCKTCDPRGGVSFGPKGHNLDQLGRGLSDDDMYQISSGFRQEYFKVSFRGPHSNPEGPF